MCSCKELSGLGQERSPQTFLFNQSLRPQIALHTLCSSQVQTNVSSLRIWGRNSGDLEEFHREPRDTYTRLRFVTRANVQNVYSKITTTTHVFRKSSGCRWSAWFTDRSCTLVVKIQSQKSFPLSVCALCGPTALLLLPCFTGGRHLLTYQSL